jgi:hypothetical protein
MDENGGRNDLLQFIATTVETMREQMATKADLRQLEERMATKSDLRQLEERMATKTDLRQLEERMVTKMEAGFTAIRGDIERVSLRLDTIERALSARLSQIETEMSRLRSVLYLLVKDQPELLRLLGSEPPLV